MSGPELVSKYLKPTESGEDNPWITSACPLPGPRPSVGRDAHPDTSDGRRTRNPRSYRLAAQIRVIPPTGRRRSVHIWDSEDALPRRPTCQATASGSQLPHLAHL